MTNSEPLIVSFRVEDSDIETLDRIIQHFADGDRHRFLRDVIQTMASMEQDARMQNLQEAATQAQIAKFGRRLTSSEILDTTETRTEPTEDEVATFTRERKNRRLHNKEQAKKRLTDS